ncbi:MAG: excisionase [Actinobacteria bacterium]|jgi:excisionase family DNA binding protein|nr:MAG: excisionase [Actinomycetota bacterium]
MAPPAVRTSRKHRFLKGFTPVADITQSDALLTPAEVAALFRVNPKTVTRWARAGKISAVRTLGGHRRFRESEIRRSLAEMEQQGA